MTQSNFSKNIKSSKSDLNRKEDYINRGVEFILNGGKRTKTKPLHIIFKKLFFFLKREVTIHFEFSFGIRRLK